MSYGYLSTRSQGAIEACSGAMRILIEERLITIEQAEYAMEDGMRDVYRTQKTRRTEALDEFKKLLTDKVGRGY